MSQWPSTRARLVYKALLKIGWVQVHQKGSHCKLRHPNFEQTFQWAFHDNEEIGPKMLARIAKSTGLRAEDL